MKDFLELQRDLQWSAYKVDPASMRGKEKAEFIRWNVLAAMVELGEALDETRWKPWSTDQSIAGQFKDRDDYVEELVDVIHFVGNLLLAAGVDDEELTAAYKKKVAKNLARQKEGYPV